ncbi:hypothetical protein F931_00065 [Acinetobacter pittii ANC 4050]|jgi:hypothetical protein|uniref:Uncharacterized protein n=1 Tax=Acinetobacter pittii ANC 4050 TaxID=1217691 RepID=R8YNL6_ACIPI|nr:hypothetical protein F931_00065 [Acinetobacter pittii ANC 4050]
MKLKIRETIKLSCLFNLKIRPVQVMFLDRKVRCIAMGLCVLSDLIVCSLKSSAIQIKIG